MTDFLRDPPRWKERTDQTRLAERAAGQMVRSMGTAEPLSGAQLTRIAARFRAERTRPHRLRTWAPAMALLFFGGVAAASVAHIDILPRWLVDIVRPGAVAPAPRAPAARSLRGRPTPAVLAPAPVATPTPVPAPAIAPAPGPTQVEPSSAATVPAAVQPTPAPQPATALRPSSDERTREPIHKPAAKTVEARSSRSVLKTTPLPPVQPVATITQPTITPAQSAAAADPVPTSGLPTHPIAPVTTTMKLAWVDQQAANRHPEPIRKLSDSPQAAPAAENGAGPLKDLSAAVHALRVERSPEAALAILDRHAGELEKSNVSHEALLLRVEAMLKLERPGEVLKLLDAAPLAGVAASRTLLLTRGELRALAGRCAEAVSDFDLVLAQTQGHSKRALAGRAKCQKPAAEPGVPGN